jgi:hypothetical protein
MDTMVLVDPNTFAERLTRAGFEEVDVKKAQKAFRFRARRPWASERTRSVA